VSAQKKIPYQITHSTRPRTTSKQKNFEQRKNKTDARGMNPSTAKPNTGKTDLAGCTCLRGHESETPSCSASYRAHTEGKKKNPLRVLCRQYRGERKNSTGEEKNKDFSDLEAKTKSKRETNNTRYVKISFLLRINKITIDPRRSLFSLPHLIIGMKIEFLTHSL
jgi:hypothetical protein